MSTTLPRINVEQQITSELAQQRKKLLTDAATKLNYKLANPKTLLHQLVSIGIVPFKTSAVEAYMKSKEKNGMYSETRKFLIWNLANLTFILTSVLLIHILNGEGFLYFIMGLIVFGSFMGAATDCHPGRGKRTVWSWHTTYLHAYEGAIPDHVLNTALQVKGTISNATFQIAHLDKSTDYREIPVRTPDPFLRVSDGNEQYYIEQWDERDQPRHDE